MKLEVKEILDGIGFETAKLYQRSLFFRVGFDEFGGLPYTKKAEAQDALKQLKVLEKKLLKLPPRVRELWDRSSRSSDDWDSGRSILNEVMRGLGEVIETTEHAVEDPWGTFGSERNRAADSIAYKMLEIYVLGTGDIPGGGRNYEAKTSNPYSVAVQKMFSVLGVDVSYRQPCDRAVKKLKRDNRSEELKALRRISPLRNLASKQ